MINYSVHAWKLRVEQLILSDGSLPSEVECINIYGSVFFSIHI